MNECCVVLNIRCLYGEEELFYMPACEQEFMSPYASIRRESQFDSVYSIKIARKSKEPGGFSSSSSSSPPCFRKTNSPL